MVAHYRRALMALLVGLSAGGVASGWWVKGHESVTEAAASKLPDTMPAFFRAGGKAMAHFAGDPDRWKNPDTQFSKLGTSPDHYIDLELYEGKELPRDRFKAIALLATLKQKPEIAGLLPWAIMEYHDRLCGAFYDHRADPNNEAIRMKCLVYAGNLAHFTGDTVMPLHTTKDYDGRKQPDGTILQKGIHAKIDAFPERNGFLPEEISRGLEPKEIPDLWDHVVKTIQDSYTHIGTCYDMDQAGAFDKPTPESREFIMKRCKAGAQFTMDVWHHAWIRSANLRKHY